MDQVRNFAQSNRSSIVNIIYIVAIVVLVYYLFTYFFDSEVKDKDLQKNKISTSSEDIPAGGKTYTICSATEKTMRAKNEYTLSFWLYITNFTGGNNYQNVLFLADEKSTDDCVLYVGIHPTKPKMIIRAGNIMGETLATDSLTKITTTTGPASAQVTTTSYGFNTQVADASATSDGLDPCDIMDIDLQRWINITVSVNGRIMDVYLDGKLARSCILNNVQDNSSDGAQSVVIFPGNKPTGYLSGMRFSNYAVTPDVIYGRYQAGPYFSAGFLDYLVEKLGIKITYQGTGTTAESVSIWEQLGLKS